LPVSALIHFAVMLLGSQRSLCLENFVAGPL
jgi:hypothetical protein